MNLLNRIKLKLDQRRHRRAQRELADAQRELSAEMQSLRVEISKSNAIAQSSVSVGLREAERALADMISRQISEGGSRQTKGQRPPR